MLRFIKRSGVEGRVFEDGDTVAESEIPASHLESLQKMGCVETVPDAPPEGLAAPAAPETTESTESTEPDAKKASKRGDNSDSKGAK